jgi:hypothetical protein
MNRSLGTSSFPRLPQKLFLRKSVGLYFGGTGMRLRISRLASSSGAASSSR